jgi:hypothetical protein
MAGKVIGLKTGETVTFGRAAGRAQFALPHDTFMSGVHFAVECGTSGCRAQDRKSSNGTFLNGARIQDAMLANGDEIKSGQTVFAVKIVSDAKLASLVASQQAAPPAVSERPLCEAESAPPSAPERSPRNPEPASEPRPRVAESALPAAPEPRPRATPPLAPEPPAEQKQGADARGPGAEYPPSTRGPSAGHLPSAQGPVAEPPSPAMRTADLGEKAADPRPAPDDAVVAAQESDPAQEPGTPRFLGTLEPQRLVAADAEPGAEPPAVHARPHVEEPPHLRAIPTPPVAGPWPQRAGENPPDAGVTPPRAGASPPGAREGLPGAAVKPPRVAEPPAGVAPHMAEKFAERPGARDAGGARNRAFSVMGWSFPAAPAEWQVQEGFGLQQSGHEEFPGSLAASEELLGGITLQQFVESQISVLRGYLRDPKIEPRMPPRVGGADESMAMDVRHSTKDGRELVYRRIYARSGASVGVLTVTTLAAELPQVLQSLQPLLDGAAFRATVNN